MQVYSALEETHAFIYQLFVYIYLIVNIDIVKTTISNSKIQSNHEKTY